MREIMGPRKVKEVFNFYFQLNGPLIVLMSPKKIYTYAIILFVSLSPLSFLILNLSYLLNSHKITYISKRN